MAGFFTFFLFLFFGYFDPFHAFVTAILTQFLIMCLTMQQSPPQPPRAEWRESAAWRRALWGQLTFICIGVALTVAGIVISAIGSTSVFVAADLEFMRTTAARLAASYERLVPLVAHDRATLGGMLIANGIVVWLSAQWGFRAGERWLWTAFAWAGNLAFASAVIVHAVVGYDSPLHLAPAVLGWAAWNIEYRRVTPQRQNGIERVRHAARRGALRELRCASGARLPGRSRGERPALLHQWLRPRT